MSALVNVMCWQPSVPVAWSSTAEGDMLAPFSPLLTCTDLQPLLGFSSLTL